MTASQDPSAKVDPAWQRVLKAFADAGVDQDALESAVVEGSDGISRMVARHLMFPGVRKFTAFEVYEKSGVDQETARSLWRAMGFPIVPDGEVAFTDADIEAVELATRLFDRMGMDRAIVLQQARSMGQAAARIAASHQDVIAEAVTETDQTVAAAEAVSMAEEVLPALDRLLVYMYRRHLAAATEQRLLTTPSPQGGVGMSVGFADLSRFTEMSQELNVRELAALIDRFNSSTAEVVAQAAGRVIKTIGDEVMFAAHNPGSAAAIALALLDAVSDAEDLPPLRVGLATGEVITREGDVFGVPVNLASRLVATARSDTALVDRATRDALVDDERFHFTPLTKLRLKGFGHVRAFRLRSAERPVQVRPRRP